MIKVVVVTKKPNQLQVFNSRQNLIDWVRNMAFSLGFVIVIKRSKKDSNGDPCKVVFECDRGGMHRSYKNLQ
jgi:hypothetical protein